EELQKQQPDDPVLLIRLADTYQRLAARSSLSSLFEGDDRRSEQDLLRRARRLLDGLLRLHPDNATAQQKWVEVTLLLGSSQWQVGEHTVATGTLEAARHRIQRLLADDPGNVTRHQLHFKIAFFLNQLQKPDDPEAALRQLRGQMRDLMGRI